MSNHRDRAEIGNAHAELMVARDAGKMFPNGSDGKRPYAIKLTVGSGFDDYVWTWTVYLDGVELDHGTGMWQSSAKRGAKRYARKHARGVIAKQKEKDAEKKEKMSFVYYA